MIHEIRTNNRVLACKFSGPKWNMLMTLWGCVWCLRDSTRNSHEQTNHGTHRANEVGKKSARTYEHSKNRKLACTEMMRSLWVAMASLRLLCSAGLCCVTSSEQQLSFERCFVCTANVGSRQQNSNLQAMRQNIRGVDVTGAAAA